MLSSFQQENSLSMFDLFRSRDKAVRWLLTGLLVLVALSMVTYLIPGSGAGYGGSTDQNVVAQIGKDQLTAQEVSRAVQNMSRGRQMPPELMALYVPQMVQQMVADHAMAYEAQRLGLQVSETATSNAIRQQLPPQLFKDGQIDTATYQALLAQQGMTVAGFESDTARQLLIQHLRDIVSQGVIVTPQDVEAEFRKRNEKVKLEYAQLQPAKYQSEAEPTDAEMKTYYDSHRAEFQIPEKRSIGVIVLDPDKVAASIPVSDAELQKEYNSNLDKYRVAERVKVRHILIKSDAANDAASKSKAENILKQIQSGGDFAKLAKDNSQDPGSAQNGGELGWIGKGQTVAEFEKAAFSLQPGQTSGLIKTMYGYHILQVEQHENAHLQPFDEVKAQIAADYRKREANQQMQTLADKALAELRKDPLHPEKAAAALGPAASFDQATSVQIGDPVPGVGVSKEFNDAIGSLRKGEVTPGPIVLNTGKVVLASITDFQPTHQASFDEARNDVRNKVSQQKLQKILAQKAQELYSKAQAEGGDLAKAAKETGLEVKTTGDLDRNGSIEGVGSVASIPDAFTKPVNSIVGPVPAGGGQLVAKIVAKTQADMSLLPAQQASIRDELKQQKARDRIQLFEAGLRKRLEQEGKLKVHQDVLSRIVQNYSQKTS
jgi:peptidyl-prolyl cis-trans isomerase D